MSFYELTATGLVVYDSVLFERGHMVNRWINGVERTFTRFAIEEAPLNQRGIKNPGAPPVGTLKASLWGETDKVGPKHWQAVIHSDAPYSIYVLEGTTGPITPHGPFLKLPRNPAYGGRRTRFYAVAGQEPNNFLDRAAARTAVSHPSLRGFATQAFNQT